MMPIDEMLSRAVEDGIVAGVVALATTSSDTLYRGAFGGRALHDAPPMTEDTVFRIASMTKALTATACLQLVERGLLHLDRSVAEWVPALARPRILAGFDQDGAPILRPARAAITLRQLLTHTSGFAYGMWHADMARHESWSPIPRNDTFDNAESCLPLAFEPGEGWAYGAGIDWAGKAVEAVTGQTLEQVFRDQVFLPLAMHDTGYRLAPAMQSRLAGMNRRQADGSLAPVIAESPQNPRHFLGGGGLFGTGPDYLRFIRMMLNGGVLNSVRVLQAATVEMMGRNSIGALDVPPMRSAMPELTNDADFYPAMAKKWGLSFLINTDDVPGARRAGSLAWAGLYNTYYWIDPRAGVGGVLLTQVQPFADPGVLALFDAFERAVYAS